LRSFPPKKAARNNRQLVRSIAKNALEQNPQRKSNLADVGPGKRMRVLL